jgi:hypothetical protein
MAKGQHAEELSPGLRPIYDELRKLLAGAARDEARSRHQVGVLIARVKNAEHKYGLRAVEQLSRALGSNVHTLYRCAAVAECWSRTELELLLQRTTAEGHPLSWSHLVLLAGVVSPRQRATLLEQTLAGSLSVRQLAHLLGPRAGEVTEPTAPRRVLRRVVRAAERWAQLAAAMHDELLAELEAASGSDDHSAKLLDRAIAAEEELHGIVRQQLTRLRHERDRFATGGGPRSSRSSARLLAGVRQS